MAYKPNLAFYESAGESGWRSLQKTLDFIPADCFTIADAKRGDIGNTSALYARAFFEKMNFDAVTVAPYMGSDSVQPFLTTEGKWVILLAYTSNAGSADFQNLMLADGDLVWEKVIRTTRGWAGPDRMMYVIGATHPDDFKRVRSLVPEHFLLVPGVGAQGGDLQALSRIGMNEQCGLLVNSSRQIIYASTGTNFAEKAREAALMLQAEMSELLSEKGLI